MLPLAVIGVAAGIGMLGSALGAYSDYEAAKDEAARLRKQYESYRKQSLFNAQIADFNRGLVLERRKNLYKEEASAQSLNAEKGVNVLGKQKLAMAANGVMLGGGSATEIQKTTMWQNSLEADAIRKSYETGRWDYEMQAINYKNQADQYRRAASEYSNLDINVSSTPYIAKGLSGIAQTGFQAGGLI